MIENIPFSGKKSLNLKKPKIVLIFTMRLKSLKTFNLILILSGCFYENSKSFTPIVSTDSKLSEFVIDVIKDLNAKQSPKNNDHDVSIVNLDSDNIVFNSIVKNMPKENPVLQPQVNCKGKFLPDNVYKHSQSFIVIAKSFTLVSILYLLLN